MLFERLLHVRAVTHCFNSVSAWIASSASFRKCRLTTASFLDRGIALRPSIGTLSVIFLGLLVLAIPCGGQTFDRYGGRKDIPCTNRSQKWHTEEIANRWWVCTPDGNAMFVQGVENVEPTDDTASQKIKAKYGGPVVWSEATLKRLNAWGFNTLGVYAYNMVWPTAHEEGLAGPQHSHTVKLPFFSEVRPALYSMTNPSIQMWKGGNARFLSDPVKNIFGARSIFFDGYVPPGGVSDYFDPKIDEWMKRDIADDWTFGHIRENSESAYLMGIFGDDGDELQGFSAGPDFPTVPPGRNNPNLSLLILSESPIQTANSDLGAVYADTAMHTKRALRDTLESHYHTIQAVNEAWGSNYTTFDSSGIAVGAEPVAKGNGSAVAFSHTVAHPSASRYSIQISVNGTPAGGDDGKGTLYGANLAGTVDYKSGSLKLQFQSGHAPPADSPITVSYVQNGWGIGSGLMDEDMRPAHRAWLGASWSGVQTARASAGQMRPAVKTDLDAFLKLTAEWYFKLLRDGIRSRFPNTLVMLGLGTWSGVPPAPVLQAAGEYLDLIENNEGGAEFDRAHMDFMARYYGNKPYLPDLFLEASADSALAPQRSRHDGEFGDAATQAEKGAKFLKTVTYVLEAKNSLGVNPHIGFVLWAWMDMWSEKTNWGLVSHLDNSYDGREDVAAIGPCSPPLQNYSCGGEPGNYGDYISKVREANSLWHAIAPTGGTSRSTKSNGKK
jgi:hypothetical protein